jgi:hypothetical protein
VADRRSALHLGPVQDEGNRMPIPLGLVEAPGVPELDASEAPSVFGHPSLNASLTAARAPSAACSMERTITRSSVPSFADGPEPMGRSCPSRDGSKTLPSRVPVAAVDGPSPCATLPEADPGDVAPSPARSFAVEPFSSEASSLDDGTKGSSCRSGSFSREPKILTSSCRIYRKEMAEARPLSHAEAPESRH